MSFPRYPEYKDSGVEWLGEVPEHWDIKRLTEVCEFQSGKAHEKFIDDDGEFVCVNSRFVSTEGLSRKYCTVNFSPAKRNDILMVMSDLPNGRALAKAFFVDADEAYAVNQRVCILTAFDANPKFLFHLLNRNPLFLLYDDGINQTHLSNAVFTKFPTLIPPLAEQAKIAAFLDRETAKIDALVAEQQRLMALLKEKRQAVISHVVTRGLNPHAPMKPSGIEWLGDVPEHWDVLPIKRIVSVPITDGPHETPNFIDEGVPFVSAEAVSSGSINFSKVRACISEEDNARYSLKYAPKLHDIYMVKSGATTGVTAIVEDRTDFNIWSPLAAIRCNDNSVPHFVLNFLRSKNFQEAVTLNWSFGTQQNIGMGVIENLACTVPPVEEQFAIAEMLKSGSAKFDTLTTEAQRAIDLLHERRTALISAAVTGQIDVRQT